MIPDGGSKKGRHLKILTEIYLTKLLMRRTKLRLQEQTVWVEFKYENMAFLYFYGLVGHSERTCTLRTVDTKKGKLQENQNGDWLRTNGSRPGSKDINPHSQPGRKSYPLEPMAVQFLIFCHVPLGWTCIASFQFLYPLIPIRILSQ